jgi:hypothetical protein
LGSNRNISANGGFDSPARPEWGGVDHTMWASGGTGGNGPTFGYAFRNCGLGVGGSCTMVLTSGAGLTGPVNIHQVYTDLGSDSGNAWYTGRPRSVNAAIFEAGPNPFFVNMVVTDGPTGSGVSNNSTVVLANVYCNFVMNAWTTCSTPNFTSTTGTYTVAIYNGDQQGSNQLRVDNVNVVIS